MSTGHDTPILGPWATPEVNARYQELAARSAGASPTALLGRLDALVAAQARWVDRECLNLNPATNVQNPYAARLAGAGIGSRPSLGHPGAKYEMGLAPGEELEVIASELARQVFRCAFADVRLLSGVLANLAVYMAVARPGDVIFTLPAEAGGHASHQAVGAAGAYGLDVRPIALRVDAATASWEIDLERLAGDAERAHPALIVLGGSLALAPYPIREVAEIARRVGARLHFDAAHLSLLIAGEAFQQPLREGADVMTTSTYKAFGGPPGGLILTDDPELAGRIDRVVYPGLTANNDLGRVAALAVALNDLRVHGHTYARRSVESARGFAAALAAEGFSVAGRAGEYTCTHHVALDARPWGGGTRTARRLEPANMLTTGIGLPLEPPPGDYSGLRLGTQELVRWGMAEADMPDVARLMARILIQGGDAAGLRDEVVALRARFQTIQFVVEA